MFLNLSDIQVRFASSVPRNDFFPALDEFSQTRHVLSRPCHRSSLWRQPAAMMDCAVPASEVDPKTINTPERTARLRYRAAIRRTRRLIRVCYKHRHRRRM